MTAIAELLPETVPGREKENHTNVEPEDGFLAARLAPDLAEIRDLLQSGKKEEPTKRLVETEVTVREAVESAKPAIRSHM